MPEFRCNRMGASLVDRLKDPAKEAECTHFWTQVWVAEPTANVALKASLAYGFKVIEANNGRIIMTKEIGG